MINEHGTKHDALLYWLNKDRKEIVKKNSLGHLSLFILLYCPSSRRSRSNRRRLNI